MSLKSDLIRKFNETSVNLLKYVNFRRGIQKEFTIKSCKLHFIIDKIYSSEIHHHSGNLWFRHQGLLDKNLRKVIFAMFKSVKVNHR